MTTEVVTVTGDVPFKKLAAIMIERGVSALPVLDHQGRVTGVVSETDLLRKEEYQQDPQAKRPPRWRHHDARAHTVDGVVDVVERLDYARDDARVPP